MQSDLASIGQVATTLRVQVPNTLLFLTIEQRSSNSHWALQGEGRQSPKSLTTLPDITCTSPYNIVIIHYYQGSLNFSEQLWGCSYSSWGVLDPVHATCQLRNCCHQDGSVLHALKSLSNLASFLHLVSFHEVLVHQYFTMMSPLRLPRQHETALSGQSQDCTICLTSFNQKNQYFLSQCYETQMLFR